LPATAELHWGLGCLHLHRPPHHGTGNRIPHLSARVLDLTKGCSELWPAGVQLQNEFLRNLFYKAV
jgi:hypothetical protein